MPPAPPTAARRCAAAVATVAVSAVALLAGGCSTGPPRPLGPNDLTAIQTFPFFKLYWAGRVFAHQPVTAADGLKGYSSGAGETIQYGGCGAGNGPLHTGGCRAPLQITTVIYRGHCNTPLGRQRNLLIRGVPATAFDGGRSIELYTGRVAVDVYADTPAHALGAARELRPVNAPGSAGTPLPPPAYHPGLVAPAPPYRVAPTVAALDNEGVRPLAQCTPSGA